MSGLEWGLAVFIGIGLVLTFIAVAAVISSDEEGR
jgi:hypothetical protein